MKVMLEDLKINLLNISLLHMLIGVFHPVMIAQGLSMHQLTKPIILGMIRLQFHYC